MWPAIVLASRTYAPYIVFPVAVVVGTVGYFLESKLSDRNRGKIQDPSTLEKRRERLLNEEVNLNVTDLTGQIPKSILSRNLHNPSVYE